MSPARDAGANARLWREDNKGLPCVCLMIGWGLRNPSFVKVICHSFFILALMSCSLTGQTITEAFTGSTAPGWVLGGNSYTPILTSGGIDPTNNGWLRLTDNANNRATYAYYDTAVSSANRTVFTSFDYASYNGTGADGITLFLFDGSAEFSEGAFGGSMGYAPKTIAAGGAVDK